MIANFCDPTTYFMMNHKRKQNAREYYSEVLRNKSKMSEDNHLRCLCEFRWFEQRRPYYRLFPSILPMFHNLKLDLKCNEIIPPVKQLAIQFPSNKLKKNNQILHNIIINLLPNPKKEEHLGTFMLFYFEEDKKSNCEMLIMPHWDNLKMEFLLSESEELKKAGLPTLHPELLADGIRYYSAVCLVHDDPELVKPDVLNDDKEKFERSGDKKYIKKAHQRGKVGWNIGQDVEKSAHWRNGCMALYWTGEGRRVPKVRWRTGSLVHSEVISKVPMGYLDDEKSVLTELTK